jgi:hypothetical protein
LRTLSSIAETIAAIDGTVVAGLEGNLARFAAFRADGVIHLTLAVSAAGVLLAGIPACLAALGFIGEAFFSVEFLFAGGESEFLTAVFADESFVLIHEIPL